MEMKLYEKLGVLYWKKFVLWVSVLGVRNPNDRKGTNYYLKDLSLKSVKDFRKWLWFNALVHIFGFMYSAIWIIYIIINIHLYSFYASILFIIIHIIFLILNLYCIMLQRYNYLRIKKVLKRAARK